MKMVMNLMGILTITKSKEDQEGVPVAVEERVVQELATVAVGEAAIAAVLATLGVVHGQLRRELLEVLHAVGCSGNSTLC